VHHLLHSSEGRRNRYSLNTRLPLRHPLEREHAIGEILAVLAPPPETGPLGWTLIAPPALR
jgi:hypothetical protein